MLQCRMLLSISKHKNVGSLAVFCCAVSTSPRDGAALQRGTAVVGREAARMIRMLTVRALCDRPLASPLVLAPHRIAAPCCWIVLPAQVEGQPKARGFKAGADIATDDA